MPAFSRPFRRLIGSACLGVGTFLLLVLLLVLPLWVQVSCQHSPAGIGQGPTNCRLQGANLIRIPWQTRQIKNLVAAELNISGYRPGWVYRPSLYTYDDEVPLARYSVSYAQAQKAQAELQAFLEIDLAIADEGASVTPSATASDRRPQTLTFTYGPPWIPLVAALLSSFCIASLGTILLWL